VAASQTRLRLPGPTQLPSLLDGFATRPPWPVAGVDYPVGAPAGSPMRKPSTNNLPQGASLRRGQGWTAIYVDGDNISLDGFDLSGLAIIINDGATGTVTITNCAALGVNIRSTVRAKAKLVVSNCTLDGGGMAADPNFQLIQVWCPLTVEHSVIANAPGGIYSGSSTPVSILYNLLEGFGQNQGTGADKGHANAIYLSGGGSGAMIAYNTIYSEAGPTTDYPLTGLGAAIGFFGDGGNVYSNATVDRNTIISAFAGAASYLVGFYYTSSANSVVSNNYIASANGFNKAGSGAFGAFYPGSGVTYSGNVDMANGNTINGDNSESSPTPPALHTGADARKAHRMRAPVRPGAGASSP
jgi:hypothetical protein